MADLETPAIDTGAVLDTGAALDTTSNDQDLGNDYGIDDASLDTDGGLEPGAEGERKPAEQVENKEEPEVSEFTSSVSARIRGLVKSVPKLGEVFKEFPKVQEQIEAGFRREAAYREVFPTVAEARQMREHFPNGLADVKQVMEDVAEAEALDRDLITRDADGKYPGHAKIVDNIFQFDREAGRSFLNNLPKEWARLDPESYNEKMGQIIGATLSSAGVPKFLDKLVESAKAAKQDALVQGLTEILDWTKGFSGEKPQPTEADRRLASDRQAFDREKQTRATDDFNRFRTDFDSKSVKLQTDIVSAHPAIKRLEKVQGISAEKRKEIVDEVRTKMAAFLKGSPSFMKKLTPAYRGGKLDETLTLQKSAWSQPWLLNRMVREVMKNRTPQLVGQNRQLVRKPAPQQQRQGTPTKRTEPFKEGKNWYHPDGRRMSVEDTFRLPDELLAKYSK